MAMLQNFALQKEKMKAKYLKPYFTNALLVVIKPSFGSQGGAALLWLYHFSKW